jgi:hypothetical protein
MKGSMHIFAQYEESRVRCQQHAATWQAVKQPSGYYFFNSMVQQHGAKDAKHVLGMAATPNNANNRWWPMLGQYNPVW